MRVLLVEDEQPLARYIAVGLRKHGLVVDIALDGRTALDKCQVTPYDVVVLDRDLPVVHGDVVCRDLAEQGTARVLMLTASGAVQDRVDGLPLGADDYLGKPFAFSELVARVLALGRRSAPARVPVTAPRDELAELAETINGMLTRIERGIAERDRALASQRLFTANAAHELRTPPRWWPCHRRNRHRGGPNVPTDSQHRPTGHRDVTPAGAFRTRPHPHRRRHRTRPVHRPRGRHRPRR